MQKFYKYRIISLVLMLALLLNITPITAAADDHVYGFSASSASSTSTSAFIPEGLRHDGDGFALMGSNPYPPSIIYQRSLLEVGKTKLTAYDLSKFASDPNFTGRLILTKDGAEPSLSDITYSAGMVIDIPASEIGTGYTIYGVTMKTNAHGEASYDFTVGARTVITAKAIGVVAPYISFDNHQKRPIEYNGMEMVFPINWGDCENHPDIIPATTVTGIEAYPIFDDSDTQSTVVSHGSWNAGTDFLVRNDNLVLTASWLTEIYEDWYNDAQNPSSSFYTVPIGVQFIAFFDGTLYTDGQEFEVYFGNTDSNAKAYIINSEADTGGTISPLGNISVAEGNSATFTITPDTGYTIRDILIDGNSFGAVSSYTFANVDRDHTIKALFTYTGTGGSTSGGGSSGGSSSSSRSSSSSGGSSRADSSTATTPNFGTTTVTRSSNVNTDGSVNATTIKTELEKAIAAATGTTATVRTRNAESISAAALRTLASTAAAANKTAILHADTMSADGKAVQGRLYVEPARLTGITTDLKLGVYTQDNKVSSTKNHFEKYFSNKITVVSFDQQGALGARLQVAAKVDVSDMNTANLVFYSFDKTNNRYTRIVNPAYFIDSSGYLHFYTEQGGSIIISDGTLTAK